MIDGSIVRVVANFMLRLTLGLLSVLMAKFVVQNALDRLKNLVAEDLVAPLIAAKSPPKCGEMMADHNKICHGCKSVRVQEVRFPRILVKLPIEVTQDSVFQNRGIPVFLCEYCDEQELKLALEAHAKRIDNK
jgi:hypothetical protein